MNLREAAQAALDHLGPTAPACSGCREEWQEAISVLRAALGQGPQITHAFGCWSWGPQHYLCALEHIKQRGQPIIGEPG